jgi:hypothetical protein
MHNSARHANSVYIQKVDNAYTFSHHRLILPLAQTAKAVTAPNQCFCHKINISGNNYQANTQYLFDQYVYSHSK